MATRSTSSASLLAALLVFGMLGATVVAAAPAGPVEVAAAAPVPASRLVVGELVTGGAGASDEFVELYHAGTEPYELAGIDVVYVTASGATVSVKASWSEPLVMLPGQHLLLANAAGVFATLADATYSGGLAATGGSLAVRAGGTVLDSLSWGNATSGYVEGTPAAAPPATWSVERAPGGLAGNGTDTGDNSLDTFLQPVPIAQGLAAAPVPEPTPGGPTPTPSDTPVPTSTPGPTSTGTDPVEPTPTSSATDVPTASPTATATGTPTPTPTSSVTPSPTPAPTPTPTPTPTATPSPTPGPIGIAVARLLPEGSPVTVAGWLTTPGGFTETGHGAFLQDTTAGIAIYLTGTWPVLAIGDGLTVTGTVDTRYGQATIKVASPAALVAGGPSGDPAPVGTATGGAGEPLEGSLVEVRADVSTSPGALSDGFSVDVDDGSGPLRVVVATATGLTPDALPRHARVRVTGVLGQRQSGSAAGFRIHVRTPADVEILAPPPTPSPSPTPSPTATPRPTATASRTPTPRPTDPSPTPSATPSPTPATITIAAARGHSIGDEVTVAGVVTAEPGRVLGERTFVIQDASGGVAVGVPSGTALPSRGDAIVVHGELVAPYGNLEVRASHPEDLRRIGNGTVPAPVAVTSDRVAEALEGRLARLEGMVTSVDPSSSGSLTLLLEDAPGEAKVFAFEGARLDPDRFARGQRLRVTGVAGQRASGAGRADGYRLWPRDPADLVILAQPSPSPTPTPSGGATPTPRPSSGGTPTPSPTGAPGAAITIAAARSRPGQEVTIAGTVTTPAGILDSDGRRVTVQDSTAAILVRLETGGPAVTVGDRIRVTGEVGTYYGAMQLAATEVAAVTGHGTVPAPATHATGTLPATAEWRLVRISGTVDAVTRDGDGWRAEIVLADGTRVPVIALPRAAIPVTMINDGAAASVTGVVRPPYPTASDRRSAVLPRSSGDIASGGEPNVSPSPGSSNPSTGTTSGPGSSNGGGGSAGPGSSASGVAAQLAQLPDLVGQRVRVGGTVTTVDGTTVRIHDATGEGVLRLGPSLAAVAAELSTGEAVNASGEVVREPNGAVAVAVDAVEDLQRAGSLGGSPASSDASAGATDTGAPSSTADDATGSRGAASGGPPSGAASVALLAAGSVGMLGLTLLAVGVWPALRRRLVVARPSVQHFAERLRRRIRPGISSPPAPAETATPPVHRDPDPVTLAALPPPS